MSITSYEGYTVPAQLRSSPTMSAANYGKSVAATGRKVIFLTVGDLYVKPAQADLDGDGDEDLLFTQTGGAPLLLRNDRPIDRRWVRLKLVGTRANRDALGATVQLKAGGKTQWRTVTANRGYLSSSALPLTFGLGEATGVESIEVVWPGGQRQSVPAPQPGTFTEVRQAN